MLEIDELPERAEVVADVQGTRGLDSRQDAHDRKQLDSNRSRRNGSGAMHVAGRADVAGPIRGP